MSTGLKLPSEISSDRPSCRCTRARSWPTVSSGPMRMMKGSEKGKGRCSWGGQRRWWMNTGRDAQRANSGPYGSTTRSARARPFAAPQTHIVRLLSDLQAVHMQRSRRLKVPLVLRHHLDPQVPRIVADSLHTVPRVEQLRGSVGQGRPGSADAQQSRPLRTAHGPWAAKRQRVEPAVRLNCSGTTPARSSTGTPPAGAAAHRPPPRAAAAAAAAPAALRWRRLGGCARCAGSTPPAARCGRQPACGDMVKGE